MTSISKLNTGLYALEVLSLLNFLLQVIVNSMLTLDNNTI